MKKIITILAAVLLNIICTAQEPILYEVQRGEYAKSDSIGRLQTIDMIESITDLLFEYYESELPIITERLQIPCDCHPCGLICYKTFYKRAEPNYEDFKVFVKEYFTRRKHD